MLREALIAAVRACTPHAHMPPSLNNLDVRTYASERVEPMVQGLFRTEEQARVLEVLERSVVFLTPQNIEAVLTGEQYLGTAWKLANLYLGSYGADLLGDDAPSIVGLSEGTTCYVSVGYFDASSRFADFIVHEAAHIFLNCKRKKRWPACDPRSRVAPRDRFRQARDLFLCLRGLQPDSHPRRQRAPTTSVVK